MIWIAIAIIIVGLIISSAIKKAALTPQEKIARNKAAAEFRESQNAREASRKIYLLSRQGKTNKQIASNIEVQRLIRLSGIDRLIKECDIADLKQQPDFLRVIGIYDKFKAMLANGKSDEYISKHLYVKYDILAKKCFSVKDIQALRSKINN